MTDYHVAVSYIRTFITGKISGFLYAVILSTDKALTPGEIQELSMYGLAADCMLVAMLKVDQDQKTAASRAQQYGEAAEVDT
jgi:hypothetical protein